MAKNQSSPTPLPSDPNLPNVINRLAAIDEELVSRGIVELTQERDQLREELKAIMIDGEVLEVFDEASNFEAVLQPSFSKTYNIPRLRAALMPGHHAQVIIETVDAKVLADLVRMGVTTWAGLEKAGAMGKGLRSVSLIVRPRKEAEDAPF